MATTDVLTDVLETVRVGAACYGRVEAAAPWGIGVDADEEDAKFHVVLSGECWLDVAGQESVHLQGGDLVALPHGHAHTLRDVPSSPIRPLSELVTVGPGKCQPSITTGGNGASATLVTGSFHFEDRRN
ncbi:MAG TPA: cupin domain-containing protein, partial [Polyangiaceae bacterium]|nr:cupin domain-containing protein [Polyangiaceae bacterium]